MERPCCPEIHGEIELHAEATVKLMHSGVRNVFRFMPMVALAAIAVPLPLCAASPKSAFKIAVHRVSLVLHVHPRHRRLLGASALLIRGVDLIGSRHVHLEIFDLYGEPSRAERARIGAALHSSLPAPWQLIAHRVSRYGRRETWIYGLAQGNRMTTLICLLERGQATMVMANANPQTLLDNLQGPGIVLWRKKMLVRGLWGGLGDGSGYGPGFAFRTPSGPFNLVQLHGSTQVTTYKYLKSTLGFRFDPTGGDMRTYSLDLTGHYFVGPDEDFFGIGPNSPAQRTEYDLQQRGAKLTLGVRLARALRLGVGEQVSDTRIFGGEGEGEANAQLVFSSVNVPGLARGANLYGAFAFFQVDTRDYPQSPHRGIFLRLSGSDNNGMGHSHFGFWRLSLDGRGYLPLTHHDVLAGRVLSIWNLVKAGDQVPFFDLAKIGDSSILRGYRPYRFQGLNAVAASLEYRHYFGNDFGVFLFNDLGQVYDTRSQLTRSNLRATWGAGLLFNDSRRKTDIKLFFGVTRHEGHRWFLTLGPTF